MTETSAAVTSTYKHLKFPQSCGGIYLLYAPHQLTQKLLNNATENARDPPRYDPNILDSKSILAQNMRELYSRFQFGGNTFPYTFHLTIDFSCSVRVQLISLDASGCTRVEFKYAQTYNFLNTLKIVPYLFNVKVGRK